MKTIFYDPYARKEYLCPECEILHLKPEGIVCSSSEGGINDWNPDLDPINFI